METEPPINMAAWRHRNECLGMPQHSSGPHCSSTMETGSNSSEVKRKHGHSGMHCIAPGCTNYFYNKKKGIHYHRLPVGNKTLLKKWLQNLKRADPPVHSHSRVCSSHFLPEDYVLAGSFTESGEYQRTRTNKLNPDAVPTVFDFSQYSLGETDCPASQKTPVSTARADRRRKRKQQQDQQEVSWHPQLLQCDCNH